MKHTANKHSLSSTATLLLLAIFALCLLWTLLHGAGVYARLIARDQKAHEHRTGIQYVATKVRQAPSGLELDSFGSGDALIIPQVINDTTYSTRIYCHEGWLMELFGERGAAFEPRDGEKLMPADCLSLDLQGQLLWVNITQGNDLSRLCLFLPVSPGGTEAAL